MKIAKNVFKAGLVAGLSAFGATVAYVVVQTLQVIGVLCFPFDKILIYSISLAIVLSFILEMLALLHYGQGQNSGAMRLIFYEFHGVLQPLWPCLRWLSCSGRRGYKVVKITILNKKHHIILFVVTPGIVRIKGAGVA